MRGRPPKSAERHIREGTGRADRHPLPVLVGGRDLAEFVEPPKHLRNDAKAWWRENVPQAIEAGLLDRADMSHAALAASQWDVIVKCDRVLAQDGFFATGSTGQIKEHPAIKMQREAVSLYLRLTEQLGMGAVNRMRLGLGQLHGAALWRDLEATLEGGEEVVEGTAAGEDLSQAVGLPGA